MDDQKLSKIIAENVEVLRRKNEDYGSGNILSTGVNGIAVRLTDKVARLRNLLNNGHNEEPNYEAIADTLLDISNYGILAQMVYKGGLEEDPPPFIYLAGPIDAVSATVATSWRATLVGKFREAGISAGFFNPATCFYGEAHRMPKQVTTINRGAIAVSSHMIAMHDGPSFGTIREIEYASQLGLPVIVIDKTGTLAKHLESHDLQIVNTISEAVELFA